MKKSNIKVSTPDGTFGGYWAAPDAGAAPGVLVLQEIFGVNRFLRDRCDWLAGEGFSAFCPDLFWRLEPNIDISGKSDADMQRAFDLFGKFDIETGMKDVAASLRALREEKSCSGKVGAMGFCLGGQLAYLTAARTDADASVGYYGVSIETRLEEASSITNPLMLHIAEEDGFVPKEAQAKITAALAKHKTTTLHHYAGRDHAFAREGGENYHEEDAHLANKRTLDFLQKHLA